MNATSKSVKLTAFNGFYSADVNLSVTAFSPGPVPTPGNFNSFLFNFNKVKQVVQVMYGYGFLSLL